MAPNIPTNWVQHLYNPLPLNVGGTVNTVEESLPTLGPIIWQRGDSLPWFCYIISYNCLGQLKGFSSSLREENCYIVERGTCQRTKGSLLELRTLLSPRTKGNETVKNWWIWKNLSARWDGSLNYPCFRLKANQCLESSPMEIVTP